MALDALDPNDGKVWTEQGAPVIEAVSAALKAAGHNPKVTREDITKVAPTLTRETAAAAKKDGGTLFPTEKTKQPSTAPVKSKPEAKAGDVDGSIGVRVAEARKRITEIEAERRKLAMEVAELNAEIDRISPATRYPTAEELNKANHDGIKALVKADAEKAQKLAKAAELLEIDPTADPKKEAALRTLLLA